MQPANQTCSTRPTRWLTLHFPYQVPEIKYEHRGIGQDRADDDIGRFFTIVIPAQDQQVNHRVSRSINWALAW